MFELGARPHPPRSLYRAYLEQSDVFIGMYWESYGWVAPGESVSGLEDEYDLTPDIPMLIYIKESGQRDPRLDALLDRIRNDDRVSYVSFGNATELRRLADFGLGHLAGGALRVRVRSRWPPSRARAIAGCHHRRTTAVVVGAHDRPRR